VKRTGLPPALSLLGFVPVANVILFWVFAFYGMAGTEQNARRDAGDSRQAGSRPC